MQPKVLRLSFHKRFIFDMDFITYAGKMFTINSPLGVLLYLDNYLSTAIRHKNVTFLFEIKPNEKSKNNFVYETMLVITYLNYFRRNRISDSISLASNLFQV